MDRRDRTSAIDPRQTVSHRSGFRLDNLGHLGAVGGAAALAFAAVLALATVVAGLAAALALAVILAFTGMLCGLVAVDVSQTSLCGLHIDLRGIAGSSVRNRGSADKARESGRQKKRIELVLHVELTSLGG